MLKGLGNFSELIKQLSSLRREMERRNDELKQTVVEGSAGGGMVKVRMNGKCELLDCKIDPSVFVEHDVEMLEDLVVAAMKQALEKSHAAEAEQMGKAAGAAHIPGLEDAIARLGGGPSA